MIAAENFPDQRLFAQRCCAGLPILSPEASDILRSCEDPAVDLETLADVLGRSPAIAARLVGMANSSFYCRGSATTSLSKALQILGLVTVRGIAAGLVIGDRFSPGSCQAFNASRFWKSAVLTAQLAQLLAPFVPPEIELEKEAIHMAGLLHNIGLLAMVSQLPAEMNTLLAAQAGEPDGSLARRLHARFGFDQRQVAEWLAEVWHLPTALRAVLAHCHDAGYAGEHRSLVLLTGLGARLARGVIATDGQTGNLSPEIMAAAAMLGIGPEPLAVAMGRAASSLDALRATAEIFTQGAQ